MNESTKSGTPRRATYMQVVRNRHFFALWLAQFISNVGDWLALLPLFSLIAFRRHGSAPESAMVMVSFIIPVILLGPIAGVFVDRSSLKRTLIICDLVSAVLAAALAFSGQLYQMYLLMAGLSAVTCFLTPTQTAALPLIVQENELMVATAMNAQMLQLNQILAPAVVGLAVVWLGEKTCFFLDSASFLISASLVSLVRIPARAIPALAAKKSIWGDLKEGLRFIATHPVARILVFSIAIANGAVAVFEALFPVYIRDVLGGGSRMFGAVMSVLGIGTILGSAAVARFGQKMPRPRIIHAGFIVQAISVLVLGLFMWPAATLAASAGLGIGAAFVFLSAQTFALEEVPPAMLGRVTSTATSIFAVVQLGSFISSGFLASWLGFRNLCYTGVLLLIVTAAAAHLFVREKTRKHAPEGAAGAETSSGD